MDRILFFIIALILFSSCKDNLNKPIFEPLTLEELSKELKRDSSFSYFYERIQKINNEHINNDLKKAKYMELTYRRVYDMFIYDDTVLAKKLSNEWEMKYGKYNEKVDSISEYWKGIENKYSLDQYVKIELANVSTEYYKYSGGVKNVNLGFKIIPLKGKIDQLRFCYYIIPKINSDNKKRVYTSLLDRNWCLYSSPFSKEVIGHWEAGYSDKNKLAGKNKNEILRDYDINIEIDKVRINGENKDANDIEIPFVIKMYWEEGDDGSMKEYYSNRIIEEFIDKNYKPLLEYVFEGLKKKMREIDALSIDYLDEYNTSSSE